METYEDHCRTLAKEQMPGIPAGFIDSLPVDEGAERGPSLTQSGGWVMVIDCGNRCLSQDEEFLVMEYASELDEGTTVYEGPSWGNALAALLGGLVVP